jgi:dynein heavy chain
VCEELLDEVRLSYNRACNKMALDQVVATEDLTDEPTLATLTPPAAAQASVPAQAKYPVPGYDMDAARQHIQTLSFATERSVVKALSKVHMESEKVASLSLFNVNLLKCVSLDDFQLVQTQTYEHVSGQLRNVWAPTAKNTVIQCLRSQGKGWFNLKEADQHSYDHGKLRKFFCLVRLVMQDTLRALVNTSVISFVSMIEQANAAMLAATSPTAEADAIARSQRASMVVSAGAKRMSLTSGKRGASAATATAASQEPQEGVAASKEAEVNVIARGPDGLPLWGVRWGTESLYSEHLAPKEGSPLFLMTLKADLEKKRFTYSTPPETFEKELLRTFDDGMRVTNGLPDMEPVIMSHLFWVGEPKLESVDLQEPWVVELRERLRFCVRASLQPLQDYAMQYERYRELLELNVKAYIDRFMEEDRDAGDIKKECERHIEARKKIEAGIPNSVTIGMFHVACDLLRSQLSDKCQQLAHELLEMLSNKLRRQADTISDEFNKMAQVLYARPNGIEDLMDQREFMKTVPDTVRSLDSGIQRALTDWELLQDFNLNLSDSDFAVRWQVFGWPQKIAELMDSARQVLAADEERFIENLGADQKEFSENVASLQMIVAGFASHSDIDKTELVAVEVRKIAKALKESQQQAQTYNNRERLCGLPVTDYEHLNRCVKDFEPFKSLWLTTDDWTKAHKVWMSDSFLDLDPEALDNQITNAAKTIVKCSKAFRDTPGCLAITETVSGWIEEFRPYVPLIQALRNPGMRERHWQQLSERLGFEVVVDKDLTFRKVLDLKLDDYMDIITKVGETAGKEYGIEQALDNMEKEWAPVKLEILAYKETGTSIMKSAEESAQLLDDHIVMTQAMSFSPYKKPFEQRITSWENKLRVTQDVMEEWSLCQRNWLYLEPIFGSEDIQRQLPTESKRYQKMDSMWRRSMDDASRTPGVIKFCSDVQLLETFRECNKLLDQVQKGLSAYLETKRGVFPRFYFLSDDELLEILSQTKDPTAVQPHMRKCFDNIARLTFEDDLRMSQFVSADGEAVTFREDLFPEGNVEDWLLEVERVMVVSLRSIFLEALTTYYDGKRTDFVLQWPGQIVIAACQATWTSEVEKAIEDADLKSYNVTMRHKLSDLVALIRGKLNSIQRNILSALIVIEVHAKDVVAHMASLGVERVSDFEWISQLRYYWEQDERPQGEDLHIKAVNAVFNYGYEYLGNSGRLVITPLTDRCYLTLTGALSLVYGGAPAGPAGTGKTETTKDLAKAMAIQCVVFNCSDQLDYIAMGKFFKGLASAGAWACFDEFNRIDIEVLSVVAQQVATIQQAIKNRETRFLFEGVELSLRWTCAPFITMNPGYAGRTELPDNLAALFRPVAMMVPDYAMIAEIMLYSFGFDDAKALSRKITTVFKLSSEQLSSQDHYDFGMRAVKTVISAAGNLKRAHADMGEDVIVLRAIREVNVPKFLADDLVLFDGIVSDLFPHTKTPQVDYGALEVAIRDACRKHSLQPVDGFVTKVIQLYETTVVRHGLMLVGPTGSGKTRCYEVLASALTSLAGQSASDGAVYTPVHPSVLNPKSITMGQLYGAFDEMTHEWTDGILSTLIRQGVAADNNDKRWYVFDGPVDAIWIENMNTVLDDNKKLCLASGEIIALTAVQTMMFEVEDLTVASPATVSRCGMVYLEPSLLGLSPFVESWIEAGLLGALKPFETQLRALFETYMEPAIRFVRRNTREVVTSVDSQLAFSLMKLLDCFFAPYMAGDSRAVPERRLKALPALVEPWFFFSLVWSVGATCDEEGRNKFSTWLREKQRASGTGGAGLAVPFPDEGSVYDYRLVDDGDFDFEREEALTEDEATDILPPAWRPWTEGLGSFEVNPKDEFSTIIVPTEDTQRYSYVLEKLASNGKPLLAVGATGTAKTLTITNKLLQGMPQRYVSHFITFSARTSANQTQDMIDAKLDKRRKGIYGPPLGKRFIFFVDDLNMPGREVYGAQPPIELLRQWMDHKGWYDRKNIGAFRSLVDMSFVCAMGPPGGGRNPITKRMTRHFNFLAMCEMSDASKLAIFRPIVSAYLTQVGGLERLADDFVRTTITVYNTITRELLPTPAKVHYTFNLRDLSKVFQGMLMCDVGRLNGGAVDAVRLWVHECRRVFRDRLINDEDRSWFNGLIQRSTEETFKLSWEEVVPQEPLLYGDFIDANGTSVAGGGGEGGAGNGVERRYALLPAVPRIKAVLDEALEDYNATTTARMNLVLFEDAIKHACRIGRIIRQPMGNALCLGVGGSGRQSMTRLAAYVADFATFQIELAKNYGMAEWREDLRNILRRAGLEDEQVVFLFSDTQIKDESFLEDLNNILNSGDVPGIYESAEMDEIYLTMKPVVQAAGLAPTKSNLFSAYCRRVRRNIHCVVCMSPIGEIFRARLRQFPALVNCCTIDWFSAWPDEALRSVASTFLSDLPELADNHKLLDGLVTSCVNLQQSVLNKSVQYKAEMGRTNFVTPTSYLDLLSLFSSMLGKKKRALSERRGRTALGLEKLLATAKEVADLQEELTAMQPMLKEAKEETEATMVKIAADKEIAQETAEQVGKEEAEADEKAKATQEIADDAQRDLDEALPALDAAVASLKSLNKGDITEVKSMLNPPAGVRLVMETVCIMQGVKPKKVAGDKPGTKVDDYWSASGPLLQNPQKFLDSLFNYDKENIPDKVIAKIEPYIADESFTPSAIEKSSKACTSICKWVRAMHKYHHVAKNVEPKRQALAQAKEDLQTTLEQLESAKSRLKEVNDRIADMEAKFDAMVTKKQQLEDKAEECSLKLQRAEKLISLLGDEKVRWKESVERYDDLIASVVGDIVVSAGTVAYLGPFNSKYRTALCSEWRTDLGRLEVRHTDHADLVSTLSDPLEIRDWQIYGLPKDSMSVENACIVKYSQRWPLFIDPQAQANKWIKEMEAEKLVVMKLTDRDFLRSLENAVRFGSPCLLENVGEELDPALEPILLRQTFKQAGSTVIKLGDSIIPYHDDFKFYITTKLPNPLYTPEVSTKVTLVNFTLSPSGLEDQMLGLVVAEERPDLEEAKNALIIQNAKMKQELAEIEDRILKMLSESTGSPVDDEELINTLDASKAKSQEITAKVQVAEETERDIDETRSKYVPVAVRTQLLFFCTTDLAHVDPMYQYSLGWFRQVFLNGLSKSKPSDDVEERIENINDYFTFSLFSNVCRSLFEKHKLLFAFLLCARILMHDGKIDVQEWRFLLSGSSAQPEEEPNPASEWLNERAWREIRLLSLLPRFAGFAKDFVNHLAAFRTIFDSADPQCEPVPEPWNDRLDAFQKLLLVRCIRYDKMAPAMQDFVAEKLGQHFIEPQTTNLSMVYAESSATVPLVFVLSAGTDPAADLYKFASEMRFDRKLASISLGQGQGPRAEAMFRAATERGTWVFFQNCHLAPSWMPMLERLIENIDPTKVHRDFRLWLTSMPSPKFPVAVLQNSSKMTVEPPRGIKANLLEAFDAFDDSYLTQCSKEGPYKRLLFSLCLFHGIILERRKFGSLGFNIRYPYNKSDLAICCTQLRMFLDTYEEPPYKVLTYTAGQINYGGRVTDDWDRRLQMTILEDFYNRDVVHKTEHAYSPSGVYHQIEPTTYEGYLAYIRSLPINDTPEIFGLHDNANISFANNETNDMLNGILAMGGGGVSGSAGGLSREVVIETSASDILKRCPELMDVEAVQLTHPVSYGESMNTVLIQEVIRFNALLGVVRHSLNDVLKALKGLVVMSEELELLASSLFNNQVPEIWAAKAYPSLKPLASWVMDLLERVAFLHKWIKEGIPVTFWISGFFFPQAFLTGTLQNYARKHVVSIDSLSYSFEVLTRSAADIHAKPEDGCYIYGLYLEGARWDAVNMRLVESRPKELYTSMAAIWLRPQADREVPKEGIYICPCYKTLQRAGTLSTTGHSTNFVLSIELPSDETQNHWVKRAVALICALDY